MQHFARFIESTNLSPEITGREVDDLVRSARDLGLLGVCVPPFWVKRASREIGEADLQLITVIGFPLGYQMTETKMEEARLAVRDGANELDMVMNVSAFKDGMSRREFGIQVFTPGPWPKIELAKMSKFAHEHEALLKVIIEVAYLSEAEIKKACEICSDAGADFVKTSTGFAPGGEVTEGHIRLLRETLPSNVGIKASGGIRDLSQVKALIDAGADRIGTSEAASILGK